MDIKKFSISACCGRTAIMYRIDRPIDKNLIDTLVKLGFEELKHYSSAGIMYVKNKKFIITATMGSDRFSVKCVEQNCHNDIDELENLLKSI